MVQQLTDNFWQAEARSEKTKQFIKNIKRLTRRKFTAEEKIRIVLEGFHAAHITGYFFILLRRW